MARQEMFVRNPFKSTFSHDSFEHSIPVGLFSRDYAVNNIEKEMKIPRNLASLHFTIAINAKDVIRVN